MVTGKKITVEVSYATSIEQRIVALQVEEGITIKEAILRSGMLMLFPEINLVEQKVGIFSKQKKLTECVCEGDRIEIYRSLLIDPKEARRVKAQKGV